LVTGMDLLLWLLLAVAYGSCAWIWLSQFGRQFPLHRYRRVPPEPMQHTRNGSAKVRPTLQPVLGPIATFRHGGSAGSF